MLNKVNILTFPASLAVLGKGKQVNTLTFQNPLQLRELDTDKKYLLSQHSLLPRDSWTQINPFTFPELLKLEEVIYPLLKALSVSQTLAARNDHVSS